MKYLLDSNTVSDLYEDATVAYHAIVSRLEQLSDTDEVYVSILTVYEFEYRFAKAPTTLKPRIREQITAIRQDFALLPLSETGAEIFGELKNHLQTVRGMKSENLKKHTIDLMLAANAIAAQAVLVSADRLFTDLQRLNTRLCTENWSVR
jgi:predicted nucleic acid-binding protein